MTGGNIAYADDTDWASRSLHWIQASGGLRKRQGKREIRRDPLLLTGHGVSLRVDAGTLVARDGFTFYPQKPKSYRFFKGDADLPARIIILDSSGSITLDVLTWLSEQQVPLIKIDWTGKAVAVLSNESFAANRFRAAWQAETLADPQKRMDFCVKLIARKISGCVTTLEKSLRRSDAWGRAVSMAEADLIRLENDPPKTLDELRRLEAYNAKAYFAAWRTTPLKWKESARHPVPDEWRTIGPRTSRFQLAANYNASHPVNAILNYAYAALQTQVQIKTVAEGYDPMLGIMHFPKPGSPAFVFDMMEPERPKVDRAIIKFLDAETLHPADFTIRADGVVRVNPEMAKNVARLTAAA